MQRNTLKSFKMMLAATAVAAGLASAVVSTSAVAASASPVELDKPNINLSDKNSLQRGAKLFVNYCLSCHSAAYMRYEHVGRDLGISNDVMKDNMLFAGNRIGDLMKASMSAEDAAKFFGKAPPDLTLITRVKSTDYIYSFLRSFYPDPKARTGWNNAVFPNTAMPNVLYPLQGDQKITVEKGDHGDKAVREHIAGGSMSPEEFDGAMRDLTNFLVYLGEPAKLKRYKIGFWVMMFLGVLLALTWFLKKEYWRDIH